MNQPSVIFFDEIDSICFADENRGRKLVTELLVQMNYATNSEVFILGATNTPWNIERSLRRRFDIRIYVPPPDESTRISMLQNLLN